MEGFLNEIVQIKMQSLLLVRMAATARFPPNLECIKKLLQLTEIDINQIGPNDNTALIRACSLAHETSCIECVELLLADPHVNINAQNNRKHTALHKTVIFLSGIDVAKLLLSSPVIDVNLRDEKGWSPLAFAARYHGSDVSYLELLLSHQDIDVNSRENEDWTPLMMACRYATSKDSSIQIVEKLLSHPDINPNLQNEKKMTALHFAAGYADFETFSLVLNHPKTNPNIGLVRTHTILEYLLFYCKYATVDLQKKIDAVIANPKLSARFMWVSAILRFAHPKRELPINLLQKQLVSNTLKQVYFPTALCTYSLDENGEFQKILSNISNCSSLEVVAYPNQNECKHWSLLDEAVCSSYSICKLVNDKNVEIERSQNEKIMTAKNIQARFKCYAATIFTLLALRQYFGKDVTRIIAKMVYKTRGTRVWHEVGYISPGQVLTAQRLWKK